MVYGMGEGSFTRVGSERRGRVAALDELLEPDQGTAVRLIRSAFVQRFH
jgi:hypothetical protein